MKGSLSSVPLRAEIIRRFHGDFGVPELVRAWQDRFADINPRSITRFVERVISGESISVSRDRADEAALVLGLMPADIWGAEWWV